MAEDFDWSAPRLTPEDERLVEAYVRVGRPVDDLPYSDAFEELCRGLVLEDSQAARHALYRRLLNLRKMGRLPLLNFVPS